MATRALDVQKKIIKNYYLKFRGKWIRKQVFPTLLYSSVALAHSTPMFGSLAVVSKGFREKDFAVDI